MEESENGPGLDADEIAEVAKRLSAGQYLPEYLRDRLFQTQQEAELGYAAKVPRSRVLSETMAVPLQVMKRFGEPSGDWTNKLIFGDNLQVLKELLEMKGRGELVNSDGSHGVRLCYIDPPFATKREFQGSKGQAAYRDKVEGAAFVEFLRKRLILIYELLADDGTLYLHLDTKNVHYMKVVLDETFRRDNFIGEIVWKRVAGHGDAQRWSPVHETILCYTKSASFVWNAPKIPLTAEYTGVKYVHDDGDGRGLYRLDNLTSPNPRPNMTYEWQGFEPPAKGWRYSRATMDALDADGRIHKPDDRGKRPQLKRYLEESEGRAVDDVWTDIPPVNSQAIERLGYPTQKPLALLERIIDASSNPGDLVLDGFVGSGTTAMAAEQLGRRWIGIDSGKLAIYATQGRLLKEAGQGESAPSLSTTAAFDVCAAGLYDNTLLEQLPPDEYTAFALELFGCRPETHAVGGIEMAGTRSGDPVHVFPYTETDADMGHEYFESLEERLRDLHSGPFYVIAPASRCDPGLFADVVDVGAITFFILRIPYSVIEALHQRHFETLRQPTEASAINDPIDAFGFNFVRPPEVVASHKNVRDSLTVEIKSFFRGGLDPDDRDSVENAGRGDLAMVMVDRNWDGAIFQISDYWFGDALADTGWMLSLPLSECGTRVLVIYIDTHGNERRESLDVAALRKRPAKKKASAAKSGAGAR